jgi:hypothetical protein
MAVNKWIPRMGELSELGFKKLDIFGMGWNLWLSDSDPCFGSISYLYEDNSFHVHVLGHVTSYYMPLNISSRTQLEVVIAALKPQES